MQYYNNPKNEYISRKKSGARCVYEHIRSEWQTTQDYKETVLLFFPLWPPIWTTWIYKKRHKIEIVFSFLDGHQWWQWKRWECNGVLCFCNPASWLHECDALIYFPFSHTVRILANCPIQGQNIFSSFEAHKHDKHTQYTNGLSGIGLKFCN